MIVERVVIIDDDKVSNMVCEQLLKRHSGQLTINTYTNPQEGLIAIQNLKFSERKILLLLDINMPEMTGWQFLDFFDKLPSEIRSGYRIYIMSSSVDERDTEKARQSLLVEGYIIKPLKTGDLNQILD